MPAKTRRWGKKLLSIFTALSLSAAMFILPVAPSMTANAGTITNIITGRWGAIALEYIERGTMRAIGSAAAHAETEAVANILSTTKKFLGNPMSTMLADIKKMCMEMNAKLDKILSAISTSQNQLNSQLKNIQEGQARTNYEAKKGALSKIDSVYSGVIEMFKAFNNAALNVDINNLESRRALQSAYDQLSTIYTESDGITEHTAATFNFYSDATNIALLLSSYEPSNQVGDLLQKDMDPCDTSNWGKKKGDPTLATDYYTMIGFSDAFDHEVYRDMSTLYNYAAGVVANYLEAYNLYVAYAAQLIYSGNVTGLGNEKLTDERDKQRMIDSLWNGYNQACFIVTRALVQMMDEYDAKLSGVMRDYDVNTTIHFDKIKTEQTASGMNMDGMRHDAGISKIKNTSSRMQAYQLRPFGSKTAYAIRKTIKNKQEAIKIGDLAHEAFWDQSDKLLYTIPLCYTGYTVDYYNLMMISSTSPGGWNPLSKPEQLNGLVNTSAFDKVYSAKNGLSYITEYLYEHNIKNDLPQMNGGNPYALSNQYKWATKNTDLHNDYRDIHMHFYNITQLEKGKTMSTSEIDMEDGIDKIRGQETSIFYTGSPKVAIYLPSDIGASYQYSAVSYEGKGVSVKGGGNVLNSGGVVTLRIKPDDGKYIKSLRLCDYFAMKEDNKSAEASTLKQYISADDELYKSDCGIYPDTDGYYTFKINVPFRDASVLVEYDEVPSAVHSVSLAESEPVIDTNNLNYYDFDAGILTFSGLSGNNHMNFNTGEKVSVTVMPYNGYYCKGLVITDNSGNLYQNYQQLSPEDYYSVVNGQKSYSFTMPDTDVTVKADYGEAYPVELVTDITSAYTKLKFVNTLGTADSDETIRSFEEGEIVRIEATVTNGRILSEVTVTDFTANQPVDCTINGNIISFVMPAGMVQVQAHSEKRNLSKRMVSVDANCLEWVKLIDNSGIPFNVSSRQAAPGDTVRLQSDVDGTWSALTSQGVSVPIEKESDRIYRMTMPDKDVTVSMKYDCYTVSIDEASYDLGLHFVDSSGKTLMNASGQENKLLSLSKPEGVPVYLRSAFTCEHTLSAVTSGGQTVPIETMSNDVLRLTLPSDHVTVHMDVTLCRIERDNLIGGYNVHLFDEYGKELTGSVMTVYKGQKIIIQSDPQIDKDDYALKVHADGKDLELTIEGNEKYSFVVSSDYTVVGISTTPRYYLTLGSIENGTGSFDPQSGVNQVRVTMNDYVNVYITVPKGYALAECTAAYTKSGKDLGNVYAYICGRQEGTDKDILTVQVHSTFWDNATVSFRMAPSYRQSVDKSSFIYADSGELVAYCMIQDFCNRDNDGSIPYTADSALMVCGQNMIQARFCYNEEHYPSHIKIVGESTGKVYKDADVSADTVDFTYYNWNDEHTSMDAFTENVKVIATFDTESYQAVINTFYNGSASFEKEASVSQREYAKGDTVTVYVSTFPYYETFDLHIKDSAGNDCEFFCVDEESSDRFIDFTYQFTMPASDVSISADITLGPVTHTVTIGTVTGGTASFSTEKEVLSMKVPEYDYAYFYIRAPKSHAISSFRAADTSGKELSVQKGADNVILGEEKLITLRVQMIKKDITITGELVEGFTFTVDNSQFVYDDSGKPVAYFEILDNGTSQYSTEPVVVPPASNTLSGRFVYEGEYFPSHIKIIGESTGKVYKDDDVSADTVKFTFYNWSDNHASIDPFNENVLVIPTFTTKDYQAVIQPFDNGSASFEKATADVLTGNYAQGDAVNVYVSVPARYETIDFSVKDSAGNDCDAICLNQEESGENILFTYQFTMPVSDVSISTAVTLGPVEHTATIGTITGGTASFKIDKDITETTAQESEYVDFYIKAPKNYVISSVKVTDTAGNELTVSQTDSLDIDEEKIIAFRVQMGDKDITITGELTESEPQPEPGTSDVHISTYEELVSFANNVRNDYEHYGKATACLDNNIIIAPDAPAWVQGIGCVSENKPFMGTFDGKGFAIVSLMVHNADNGALFEYIGSQGVVKDLAVIDCDFKVRSACAGGIAAVNEGLIDHCISGINTESQRLIKTIYGKERSLSSFNSAVNGTVSGGIAGKNKGTVTGCRSSAYVIGEDCGGIAGINDGIIYGCANNGPVGKDSTVTKRSAGIAVVNNGTIQASYNSGKLNGTLQTVAASIAVENNSDKIVDVFYLSANNAVPFGSDALSQPTDACKVLDVDGMTAQAFADELNTVTDDTIQWKQVSYNNAHLNQGFPVIKGRFIENITIVNNAKLQIRASMNRSMTLDYTPVTTRSSSYNTMLSAAGSRTMTCAYDLTASDAAGNEMPAELWCEGITVSVPVTTNDAQIITINDMGEAVVITPDSIANGMATFTLTEPAAFAAVENISSDEPTPTPTPIKPDDGNVKTGESSMPLTAACAVLLVSVLAVLMTRRKKNRE